MTTGTPETASETSTQASELLTQLIADMNASLPMARQAIESAPDAAALEQLRIEILGKKGSLVAFNQRMGALVVAEKPIAGKLLNAHKGEINLIFKVRQEAFEVKEMQERLLKEAVDVTLPGVKPPLGTRHPVTQVREELVAIFRDMGFRVESGPEIETEWLNFDALNMLADHPARDMQDTFYVERGYVLRTHTSPTQLRSMLRLKPPFAVITPGRVYRNDSDATHSPMFHQMEGLLVGEGIAFGHLKGVIHDFLRQLYGDKVKIRFRPSFFPFTEPSAEVDVWSDTLGRWLEVLGCGMVHPNVLRNGGIDPDKYSGFAFGLGIDRLATIRFGIGDLRLMFENDVRFLKQF